MPRIAPNVLGEALKASARMTYVRIWSALMNNSSDYVATSNSCLQI